MSEAYEAMQSMIDKLRELGESPEDIAADIAVDLRKELAENIAAGSGADGTPWQPTQAGNVPLQGAAEALGVAAVGTTVIAAVRGVYARHHYGHVRGGIARPILPGSDIPANIVELITKAAEKRFQLIMGGA